MLKETLNKYTIILASGSPRRQQFFKDLNLDFKIHIKSINEVYPKHLVGAEISDYLAKLKAVPFKTDLKSNDILITSDTIVWHNSCALGKPKNNNEAFNMLKSLSGNTHEVITSVNFRLNEKQKTINDTTKVTFKTLTNSEIWFYVNNYNVLDKAGAYGIQDWIGNIGVTNIEGSYFNVMGLPTHLVYETLNNLILES